MQGPNTQRPKMAGNWKPLPDEVYEKLAPCHPYCDRVYLCLRFAFHVEENYGSPGEWVTGKVRATKAEIITKSQVKKNLFYRKIWPELKKAGLVEDSGNGWVTLPYVWRKQDVSISPAQVLEMEQSQKESDIRVEDLERRLQNMELLVRDLKSDQSVHQEHKSATEKLDNPPQESGPEPLSSGREPLSSGHEPVNEQIASFKGLEKRDINEEEEGNSAFASDSQENMTKKGSRKWIIGQADQLWPGRGFKPETDAGYIEELEKFDVTELEAAFKRARADKAKYGNFDYLLNYLRNPALYNKKRTAKGKSKQQKGEPEHDPDIGRLNAPWLDDEKGG